MKKSLFRGLVLLGLILLLTEAVLLVRPNPYEAILRFQIEKQAIRTLRDAYSDRLSPSENWAGFEVLASKRVLYQVITNLELNRKWATRLGKKGELSTEATFARLKKQISVRDYPNNNLVDLYVRNGDESEAVLIANELAEVYRMKLQQEMLGWAERNWRPWQMKMEALSQQITNMQIKIEESTAGSTTKERTEELSAFQEKRDDLLIKILQLKVDSALGWGRVVKVINVAEPPLRRRHLKQSPSMALFVLAVSGVALIAAVMLRARDPAGAPPIP